MKLEIVSSTENAREIDVDVLVLGATSDGGFTLSATGRDIDGALDGQLSQYLDRSGYKAKVGSTTVVPTFGAISAKAVAVVGLGEAGESAHVLRRAAGSAARKLSHFGSAASTLHEERGETELAASAEGFWLGSYRFTDYKSDARPPKLRRINVLVGSGGPDAQQADNQLKRASARAHAGIWARDLTNEPASTLSPEEFAARAKTIAEGAGLEFKALDENELRERAFGGLLGVAQGSTKPPRLMEIRYTPDNPTAKLALVGKGVTYDSGGLSLKDAKSMETMKTDMAGGAAVIGAMSALPTLNVSNEVVAIVPATENMPSGSAIKPGDVLRHYGGKTSEVLNTDAEGRLILADALVYASEQKPAAIVDVATLTGAMMVALGRKAVGYFANDDSLAQEIEAAAERAGERFWRMPIYDDYRSDMDSEVADIKNTGARWGGAIYGAMYLRDFVADGIPWAHLDIAGPARAEGDHDEITKGGSGVAARTLLEWVEGRS